MSTFPFYIVDAFASVPFGGNTAGVVMLDDGDFPSDSLMQKVAAELRYSETAFVQCLGETEFKVRYFTPCGEVDLCGHATIAAFGVLRQVGIVDDGALCLNHTLAGDLKVRVGDMVMMEMAPPQLLPTAVDVERLQRIMSAVSEVSQPVQVVSTGLPDIILPVANLDELDAMNPDMDALAQLSKELNVVGVHAFAIEEDNYTAHVRNFAPLYGIPEESATGTANAALTHYLHYNGLLAGATECRFLQGEAMGRSSVITTRLEPDGTIWTGGHVAILATSQIHL